MCRYLTIVILTMFLLSGCDLSEQMIGKSRTLKKGEITKEELRDELDRFEYIFISGMRQTAEEINDLDNTRDTKRINTWMQTRVIEGLHAMTASDDAVTAYLDTWTLVVRMAIYFREGAGRSVHGDNHPKMVAFMSDAEEEIERIGKLFLADKEFQEIKNNIYRFARQHPINERFANLIVYASQEKKEEMNVLTETLRIPMAPIRALEGVDNTANAIYKVRESVERFTDVAEQTPESIRWQMSFLMDDFEQSEMAQTFLKSLNDFSKSSTRLVEVMETMPEQMRTELLTVLNESEESQQQLQATLQTATEAADQIEKTLSQFDTTSQSLTVTAQQAKEAAAAWKSASDSIQDLVQMFKGEPKEPNTPPGFGMRDFDNMLLHAGQTADKVGAAVTQIQQTVDSAQTQKQLRSVIDHIMWRLFELILAVVVVIYGGRWAFNKLRTEKFLNRTNH